MRNYKLVCAGLVLASALLGGAPAFAFTAADDTNDNGKIGTCPWAKQSSSSMGLAMLQFGSSAPGGSFWTLGRITTAPEITSAYLASCLNVDTSDIALVQDGANGAYTTDNLLGFGFKLAVDAGEFEANVFYTYTIGSGTLTEPADFEISGPPSASLEATPLAPTVHVTAPRQLTSTITSNQRLIREGRTRFIQSRRQMRGDSAGISSRNSVDFEFDGTLNATNGYFSSQGSFFQQDGNFEGTSRRVLFGDFDIQRSSDTGSTTATFTGKMAWERMLDEQNMIGYYVGADVARSNIKGTYTGEQDTYGVSVGTYFVSALQENLFVDGFVSLGVGKNDLTLANGTVDLNGDFNSRSVILGTALTGVIKQEGYEIWPELAFTYGKTRLGTIGMTDRLAAVANNSVTVDAGDVSIANLTLRPEYRLPMDGLASVDSFSLFTFAPRLLCEQVETTAKSKNCGGGAEFGVDRTSEDGRSRFVARIKADRIAKVTRSALELKFEHRF